MLPCRFGSMLICTHMLADGVHIAMLKSWMQESTLIAQKQEVIAIIEHKGDYIQMRRVEDARTFLSLSNFPVCEMATLQAANMVMHYTWCGRQSLCVTAKLIAALLLLTRLQIVKCAEVS